LRIQIYAVRIGSQCCLGMIEAVEESDDSQAGREPACNIGSRRMTQPIVNVDKLLIEQA
jgi:hypothetical protein